MGHLKHTIKRIVRFIELFVPPILVTVLKSIYLFLKNRPFWKTEIFEFEKTHNKLVIMGNGPSLNDSLKKAGNLDSNYDIIAVNGFAATEKYHSIKPNMYLLSDPAYFAKRGRMPSDLAKEISELENALVENTQWRMTIFIPSDASSSPFAAKMRENQNIRVLLFNMRDTAVPISKNNRFNLWDKNLIAFLAQTVLNTCINIGIAMRYDEIYLMGADTSWHENLHVDQKTNEVYSIDEHFYGSRKVGLFSDTYCEVPVRLHLELQYISNALSSYWDLKEYAESRGIAVYNASEYSNIDAFVRRSSLPQLCM